KTGRMHRFAIIVASRALLALLFAIGASGSARAAAWLVVSDVHYDPFGSASVPSTFGEDTNPALLDAALNAMRNVDPDPPVVIVAGDMLAHHLDPKAAVPAMRYLARRFEQTYPKAQFILALGNNDSQCGDYRSEANAPFRRETAAAWEPLVNRRGAAPTFRNGFAQRGAYVARLPGPRLRAIVIDDVVWSWRYRACGRPRVNPGTDQLRWLTRTLRATPANTNNWLIAHIPPGIDPYSTRYVHGLAVIPFLSRESTQRFLRLLDDPSNRVRLLVTGHSHKFSFRLSDASGPDRDVPMLLAPSISPVYANNPSFLTLQADASGNVGDVAETSLVDGTARTTFDLHDDFGVDGFTSHNLERVQRRLENDPLLQARFARAYDGDANPPTITATNFRAYWCSATVLEKTPYRACAGAATGGQTIRRTAVLVAIVAATLLLFIIATRVRRSRSSTSSE
ncbi:MAG: metallophosphoesterase, partial [Candidatus Eremiobacteraeota bacterium]|nr:metallophosphoesterase [Candidatus Eremiobacteraeota bacterium]